MRKYDDFLFNSHCVKIDRERRATPLGKKKYQIDSKGKCGQFPVSGLNLLSELNKIAFHINLHLQQSEVYRRGIISMHDLLPTQTKIQKNRLKPMLFFRQIVASHFFVKIEC